MSSIWQTTEPQRTVHSTEANKTINHTAELPTQNQSDIEQNMKNATSFKSTNTSQAQDKPSNQSAVDPKPSNQSQPISAKPTKHPEEGLKLHEAATLSSHNQSDTDDKATARVENATSVEFPSKDVRVTNSKLTIDKDAAETSPSLDKVEKPTLQEEMEDTQAVQEDPWAFFGSPHTDLDTMVNDQGIVDETETTNEDLNQDGEPKHNNRWSIIINS